MGSCYLRREVRLTEMVQQSCFADCYKLGPMRLWFFLDSISWAP